MSSLFIFCFNKHDLPSLKCSDQECIADCQLQKDIRLNHSGACSLEFQNVMQIITDCMLRWDSKKQTSKGEGILGTVLAFSAADKEQGRKTLHCHCQIWVNKIDQTLRNCLFCEDISVRNTARNIFGTHIDTVVTASYGLEFCITHKCNDINNDIVPKHDTPEKLFQEQNTSTSHHARHKELCSEVQGKVMSCSTCQKTISASDIINQSLQQFKEHLIPGE
jgi:hypothetical protein